MRAVSVHRSDWDTFGSPLTDMFALELTAFVGRADDTLESSAELVG